MEKIIKKIEIYRTIDGLEFEKEGKAKAHEEQLDRFNKVQHLVVHNIPSMHPYEPLTLMGSDRIWYYVKNQKDWDLLVKSLLIDKTVDQPKYMLFGKIKSLRFPDYIGYDKIRKDLVYLTDLIDEHMKKEKEWNSFINFFDITGMKENF